VVSLRLEKTRLKKTRPEEMARWTRLKGRDIAAHRDGLTPDGMEIHGLAGWYVRHFMLRVGYLDKYPDPVSVRRPVEWFIRT
jgi:hypothetical protein